MSRRFSSRLFPLLLGVLASAPLAGCGTEDVDTLTQAVTETKSAQITQTDFDNFWNAVKLKNCTFVIAAGTGTFTPSSELSQVLYGDPNGAAHKLTFAVPSVSSGSATIDITSLEAEMATTGVTLSGANANIKLAFHGQLHISVTVPIFGKLPADIQIRSSYITAAATYNTMTERVQVASVTSHIDHVTKNCGGSGWCNGIVDGVLKSNLATWIEAPLRDALNKSFDNASTTQDLEDFLVKMYNGKDPKPTQWTMTPHTLSLASSAFSFGVERP